jgi:hypothetical protein
MKHPFTDEELTMIFEIADRSVYQDFAAIADDMDIDDKVLSDLQDKMHAFVHCELRLEEK